MPRTARLLLALAALFIGSAPGAASDLPRFGLQHQVGETPGFEENFTRVQGFVPLYGHENDWIVFGDLLGSIDSRSALSSSAGIGLRFAPGSTGRVFGIYAHHDYREFEFGGGDHDFHRWGIGAEALGELWAARGNVYVNASGRRLNGILFDPEPRFVDRFLQLGTTQQSFVEAFSGVDFEVSRLIPRPFGLPLDHEIGLGAYYRDTPRSDGHHAPGVKGRLHTWWTDSLLTYVQAAHDRVFETSVNAGFIWYFGGPGTRPSERIGSIAARMATPIQRQYEIPVLPYAEAPSDVFATDPITAQRITFTHVDDNAAPGGLGTWEQPFSTLRAASRSGTDIVLVQNGTYVDDLIALSPSQRLLAVNKPHVVHTSEIGTVLLPRTGIGGASIILNSPANGVVLASGTEVTGFTITGAAHHGIFGTGVEDILIRCNAVLDSGHSGVFLTELNGAAEIVSNALLDSGAEGLIVTADDVDLLLSSNTISRNLLDGIRVEAGALGFYLSENDVSRNGRSGVNLLARIGITGEILGNTAVANHHSGIKIEAPSFIGPIAGNVASQNNLEAGIRVRIRMVGDIVGNTAIGNGAEGISISGALDGSIVDNVANGNGSRSGGAPGIVAATGGVTGSIAGNTANNNRAYGIRVQTFGQLRSVGGDLTNNVTNDNHLDGILIADLVPASAGGVGGSVSGNTANGNEGYGITITGGINSRIDGGLSNNATSRNGVRLGGSGIRVRVGGLSGDISSNLANQNEVDGLQLEIFGAGADFVGDVLNNVTDQNGRDGFAFTIADEFTGNFTGNTANLNDRYGFNTLAGGTVTGTTTGNQANGNGVADFNGNIAQP